MYKKEPLESLFSEIYISKLGKLLGCNMVDYNRHSENISTKIKSKNECNRIYFEQQKLSFKEFKKRDYKKFKYMKNNFRPHWPEVVYLYT